MKFELEASQRDATTILEAAKTELNAEFEKIEAAAKSEATKPKTFKIEKGIEKDADEYMETARWMEVEDSVAFKTEKEATRLCRALVKRYGEGSFTTRSMPDGHRVWRTVRTPAKRTKKPTEAKK